MKAAIYKDKGKIEIIEREPPRILNKEDILLKVKCCGICGSDLHTYLGRWPQPLFPAGHEISGEIGEIGDGVKNVKVGERVCVEPVLYCNHCIYCRLGKYHLCEKRKIIGAELPGGFAEYLVVPSYSLHLLRDNISFEEGVLVEPLASVIHAIGFANLNFGSRVAILGGGTTGLLAVKVAKCAGASHVFVSVKYPHQAKIASEFGADKIVVFDSLNIEEKVFSNIEDVDLVIEAVGGNAETVNFATRITRKRGKIILLGLFPEPIKIDLLRVIRKELQLIGSNIYGYSGVRRDFELAIEMISSGKINMRKILTHRFPLERSQEAFETALNKGTRSIKVLFFSDQNMDNRTFRTH